MEGGKWTRMVDKNRENSGPLMSVGMEYFGQKV